MTKLFRIACLLCAATLSVWGQRYVFNPLTNEFDLIGPSNIHLTGSGIPANPCPTAGEFFVSSSGIAYFCGTSGGNWIALAAGSGSPGTPAYTAPITAQTTTTVLAATHGQGVNPIAFCYDNASPANFVSCAYTVSASGTVVFSWSPAFTGTIAIIGATGGFANPMTSVADLIVGGTAGAATRLAKGTANQVVSMDGTGTNIVWAAGGGAFNPAAPGPIGATTPAAGFFTTLSTGTTPPALAWFTGTGGITGLADGTCTGTVPASTSFLCNNGGVLTVYRSTGSWGIPETSSTSTTTTQPLFATAVAGIFAPRGIALTDIPVQAADTVVMNATAGSAAPTATAMPTCTTGADLYNTTTHTWSCVAVGGTIFHSIGATFVNGGSTLVAGATTYFTTPFACTITAWNITVDAGTVTFDLWRLATGTAIPTVSNSIVASAFPALASGTAIHSTTLTGWGTTIAANDIIGVNLKTVATATQATLNIQCNGTN